MSEAQLQKKNLVSLKNKYIRELVAAGYRLTPLNGKVAQKGWRETPFDPDLSVDDFPTNYGVVLTREDLILDVDPRNFPPERNPLKELAGYLGLKWKKCAPVVATGGGGYHIYMKKPSEWPVRETLPEYPGLEFKTEGRQVVGPGSIHPDTGKVYRLEYGDLSCPGEAPQSLLDLLKKPDWDQAKRDALAETDDSDETARRFTEYLYSAPLAVEGQMGDKTTFAVACYGKNMGLSMERTFALMLKNYNPLCEPPWSVTELRRKVQNAYEYSQSGLGVMNPKSDFNVVTKPQESLRWDVTEGGVKKKTLNNVVNYFFLEDSPIQKLLAYNLFTDRVVFTRRAPWHDKHVVIPNEGRPWEDSDATMCRYLLSNAYKFDVPAGMIDEAALVSAHANPNHPIRNYLNSLVWDGTARLDTWLHDYAGSPNNKYTRAVASKTLIGAVARIMHPGCKFDYMTVLEGEQGTGKTSLVRTLGGPWYGDIVIDPHSADTVAAMRGKWIIEASEMVCTKYSETQALKAFLTRQTDSVRFSYARHVKDYPRQCIFIGTMNLESEPGYLQDTTGNRRFWPVKTTRIYLKSLADVRDQLFAEALHRWRKGESYHLDDESVIKHAKEEQHKRRPVDPWLERIAEWLDEDEFGNRRDHVTASQVYDLCLNGKIINMSRRDRLRISTILCEELGWEKGVFRNPLTKKSENAYRRKKV